MNDWLWHLWHDPLNRNPWALGLLVVLGLAMFSPVIIMMGRDMFRRRRKETNVQPTEQEQGRPMQAGDDRAMAEDTIVANRTDDDRSWRLIGATESGGQLRRKGESSTTLGAWSPDLSEPDTLIQETRWASEGIPATARAGVPHALVSQHREQCAHCGGTGAVPNISDYLRESIALIGDQGDQVIRTFYGTLFRAAPELAQLFPGNPTEGDLGTDHKGAKQREKLLGAIVALADLYDPDDLDRMARLDTALGSYGRSHATFVRADGTIRGATLDEYAAVKSALFQTLVQAAGNAWRPEYTESWSQAYDYAAAVMLAEQFRSGFAAPRFPRV